MSPGRLYVDGGQISRSGAGIAAAAQQLQSQITAFQGELGGHPNAFGSDQVSSLIAGIYQAISQAAMECFGENQKALADHGQRVQVMGQGYTQAEQVNTTEVNRVREILG
jgi:hypothetical protein